MIDLLGIKDVTWEELDGFNGYQSRLYYDGISIHHNHKGKILDVIKNHERVWVEMSGAGCRAYETHGANDWKNLFAYIIENGEDIYVNRLDVAFDEYEGKIDIQDIYNDTVNGNYTSENRVVKYTGGTKGKSVEHGTRASRFMIRIYDKAAERESSEKFWTRIEIQMRDANARAFIDKIVNENQNIKTMFFGVLKNYLNYREPKERDTNKTRWQLKDYWLWLLGDAEKITLWSNPGTEYNLKKLDLYVFKTSGNATNAAMNIYGIDEFREKIRIRNTIKNPKYDELVFEIRGDTIGYDRMQEILSG